MIHNIKSLIGFTVGATDGEIGKVKDFYFEDNTWAVRYLVVETGNWLDSRKVLITTEALTMPDWDKKIFPVNLTKEQVKNSPDVDTELPVYRQQEIILYDHYALGNYWRGGFVAGGMPLPMNEIMLKEDNDITEKARDNDMHLRSAVHIISYSIMAEDGAIGTISDFLVDSNTWEIAYVVIDTGNWFSGKKVGLSTGLIKEIRWDISTVLVKVTKDKVNSSLDYDENIPVSGAYARNLDAHYAHSD